MRAVMGLVCTCLILSGVVVQADVPNQMSFQGKLSDGSGNPIENQSKSVTFTIYDTPTGWSPLWSEIITVNTGQGGIFSVMLGQTNPLGHWFFAGTDRYLGIRVDTDVELSPRIKITADPYAQRISTIEGASGGTITGGIEIRPPGSSISELGIGMWAEGGAVFVKDENGDPNIVLQPDGHGTGGDLVVFGGSGHFEIEGNFQGTGMPVCYMGNQSNEAWFDLSIPPGDGSVHLPDASISATEILNEPGIGYTIQFDGWSLNENNCVDIATGQINIPAPGYVFVEGWCSAVIDYPDNDFSGNWGYFQIDTSPGGGLIDNQFVKVGYHQSSDGNLDDITHPVYTSRVFYFDTGGNKVIRLEGIQYKYSASECSVFGTGGHLTMLYYPTAYGSVMSVASANEASMFEKATPTASSNDPAMKDSSPTEPIYMVDLRDLELRVAKAEAALQKANADLMRAEMQKQQETTMARLKNSSVKTNAE